MTGDVRNAPRILLQAVFWSFSSLSACPFCPLHQASAPKSRMRRTQLVYSWRKCKVLSLRLPVFGLLAIWSSLDADAIFLSAWALKLSFRSKSAPSHRTAEYGLMTMPFGSVTGHCGVRRRQRKWISSVLESSDATALLPPHSKAVLPMASSSLQINFLLGVPNKAWCVINVE